MADNGTDAAAERDALIVLVRDYEQRTDPWPKLPPVEISDFLNGRRKITATQAVRMRKAYNVPLELLLIEAGS